MATFKRLPSGNWRVQVRRKGRYVSETFRRHGDARSWALETERRIDRGEMPSSRAKFDPTTFGHLIDLHLADMKEVGKAPRRSKAFSLDALKAKLGNVKLKGLDRERLIKFGRDRAKEGAGGVTVGMDLGYVKTVLMHAAAVHGIDVSAEPVDLARIALKRLSLISKGRERDRRPTQAELDKLLAYLDDHPRQFIPVGRLVRFAIATAMRQDEICRVRRKNIDAEARMVAVRDRKDPRNKEGNDQKVPLLSATGLDAWALLEEQKPLTSQGDRVFPYNGRSVGRTSTERHSGTRLGSALRPSDQWRPSADRERPSWAGRRSTERSFEAGRSFAVPRSRRRLGLTMSGSGSRRISAMPS